MFHFIYILFFIVLWVNETNFLQNKNSEMDIFLFHQRWTFTPRNSSSFPDFFSLTCRTVVIMPGYFFFYFFLISVRLLLWDKRLHLPPPFTLKQCLCFFWNPNQMLSPCWFQRLQKNSLAPAPAPSQCSLCGFKSSFPPPPCAHILVLSAQKVPSSDIYYSF